MLKINRKIYTGSDFWLLADASPKKKKKKKVAVSTRKERNVGLTGRCFVQ